MSRRNPFDTLKFSEYFYFELAYALARKPAFLSDRIKRVFFRSDPETFTDDFSIPRGKARQ